MEKCCLETALTEVHLMNLFNKLFIYGDCTSVIFNVFFMPVKISAHQTLNKGRINHLNIFFIISSVQRGAKVIRFHLNVNFFTLFFTI